MKSAEACQACHSCWLCHAGRKAELLHGVTSGVVEALEKGRISRHFARGSVLYHQGSCGGGLFCISTGLIKIYRTDAAGRVQIVRLAGPGEFLGFRRIFSKQASSNTAQVISPAVVCQIPGPAVLASLAADPQLAQNILGTQAQALEKTETHLMRLVGLSSPGRVASLMLEYSAPAPPYALAPLTREEMAQLAGTSIESVSRVIHEKARQGSLRLRGRTIYVEDRPALEEFVANEYRR